MSVTYTIPKFMTSLAQLAKENRVTSKEVKAKKASKLQRAKDIQLQRALAAKMDKELTKLQQIAAKEEAKQAKLQAKEEAKQAKAEAMEQAKQAKLDAKAEAKQAKLEAKAEAKQAKAEAKAEAKQAKVEAKLMAKEEAKQAKVAKHEANTSVIASTKHMLSTYRNDDIHHPSCDRVDLIRKLCDQADFCYNGQVSYETTPNTQTLTTSQDEAGDELI